VQSVAADRRVENLTRRFSRQRINGCCLFSESHRESAHTALRSPPPEARSVILRSMSTIISLLREAPWLEQSRALAWTRVLALASALVALAFILCTHGGSTPDPWGRPLAPDFVSFWTAGKLALDGAPESAWNPAVHAAAQRASFPPDAGYKTDYYAFFYPPPFLLICLPLALLPYGGADALWLLTTGAAYFATIRALLPPRWPAVLIAMAFPAARMNATHGQNGALSAALLGTAAVQLERRPWLAGVCLGALCFKPQLALLVVPALVAARRLRSLAWAVAAAATLSLASLVILHEAAWQGFISSLPLAREALQAGWIGFAKMVSPFAAARLLGVGLSGAWAIQAVVSGAVLMILMTVVRRQPGAPAEGATLAAAACLATPFLLDYDLMLLGVPLAWVAAEAERTGYLPWEKLILAAAFVLPLVARPIATVGGVPVAPAVLIALLWVVTRRASLIPAFFRNARPVPA